MDNFFYLQVGVPYMANILFPLLGLGLKLVMAHLLFTVAQMKEFIMQYYQVIYIITGAIGILVGTRKFYIHYVKPALQPFSSLPYEVNLIKEQLENTGGQSLKDVIDRIDNKVSQINQRHKLITSSLGLAMFEADADGKTIYVNKEWCEMTGLLPNESKGNGWINGVDPKDRQRVWKEWNDAISQQRDFMMEYNLLKAHVMCHAVVVRDNNNEVMGTVGVLKRLDS